MEDRIYDIKQVAEMLCISENTLRWHRFNGSGPKSFKIGRKIAYRDSDLQAYIASQLEAEDARLKAMGK